MHQLRPGHDIDRNKCINSDQDTTSRETNTSTQTRTQHREKQIHQLRSGHNIERNKHINSDQDTTSRETNTSTQTSTQHGEKQIHQLRSGHNIERNKHINSDQDTAWRETNTSTQIRTQHREKQTHQLRPGHSMEKNKYINSDQDTTSRETNTSTQIRTQHREKQTHQLRSGHNIERNKCINSVPEEDSNVETRVSLTAFGTNSILMSTRFDLRHFRALCGRRSGCSTSLRGSSGVSRRPSCVRVCARSRSRPCSVRRAARGNRCSIAARGRRASHTSPAIVPNPSPRTPRVTWRSAGSHRRAAREREAGRSVRCENRCCGVVRRTCRGGERAWKRTPDSAGRGGEED